MYESHTNNTIHIRTDLILWSSYRFACTISMVVRRFSHSLLTFPSGSTILLTPLLHLHSLILQKSFAATAIVSPRSHGYHHREGGDAHHDPGRWTQRNRDQVIVRVLLQTASLSIVVFVIAFSVCDWYWTNPYSFRGLSNSDVMSTYLFNCAIHISPSLFLGLEIRPALPEIFSAFRWDSRQFGSDSLTSRENA
jgi:hypothetical protein